jgi:hypothetical protein
VSSPFATAYLHQHLIAETAGGLPPGATVGRCPTTEALWLAVHDGPATVLLRGAVGREEPEPESTGFYL